MDAMEQVDRSQRHVTVRTAQDRGLAKIEISDTGPGIPAGKLNEVFEPFYTTKPNGMGMGLSIARTIIDAHGGQILAEGNSGRGALVGITLPLASAAASGLAAS